MSDEVDGISAGSVPDAADFDLERSADEGLLIAMAALRIAVKNDIILAALRDGKAYDPEEVSGYVRSELLALAGESVDNAERLDDLAGAVLTRRGAPRDSQHYTEQDYGALTRRTAVQERLSLELERLSKDPEWMAQTAEAGRYAAWDEIAEAIGARLQHAATLATDPNYEVDKDERLRDLVKVDFVALEKRLKRAEHPSEESFFARMFRRK